jgi:hypothetical protein
LVGDLPLIGLLAAGARTEYVALMERERKVVRLHLSLARLDALDANAKDAGCRRGWSVQEAPRQHTAQAIDLELEHLVRLSLEDLAAPDLLCLGLLLGGGTERFATRSVPLGRSGQQ